MFEWLRQLDERVLSILLDPAGARRPRHPGRAFLAVSAVLVWVATLVSMSDWLG